MDLAVRETVTGPQREELWLLHDVAFRPLRAAAAQRHYLTRDEFDDVVGDKRITKHVATDDDGRAVGLATLTNDLDAVPLVSPEFFAARWPELYAEGRIWYIVFLAVHPDHQGTDTMAALVGSLCRTVSAVGGMVGADFCEANRGYPEGFIRVARQFVPRMERLRLDAQTFWAYDVPVVA